MSIYIIISSQSEQNKLFYTSLDKAKNCKYGEEVVVSGSKPYVKTLNSLYTWDVKHAEDAKTFLAYLFDNPLEDIKLNVEEISIELRINKSNSFLNEIIPKTPNHELC
jgi:hypothetical protein